MLLPAKLKRGLNVFFLESEASGAAQGVGIP